MSKINKNFTLDIEIVEKLRQIDNASALVENLLKQHFQFNGEKKNSLMNQMTFQLKNYSQTAKFLKKNIKILAEFEKKGIDKYLIRWLRGQEVVPTLSEVIAYRRDRSLEIKSDEIIKTWEVVNKNVQLFEKI
jgi:hypothetical protein